ncbi:hypothetical protein ACFQL4_25845 [Halosimplex aquaticum]
MLAELRQVREPPRPELGDQDRGVLGRRVLGRVVVSGVRRDVVEGVGPRFRAVGADVVLVVVVDLRRDVGPPGVVADEPRRVPLRGLVKEFGQVLLFLRVVPQPALVVGEVRLVEADAPFLVVDAPGDDARLL